MCDNLNTKYGFSIVDDECMDECKDNPLVVPKLIRYIGMGWYQILAIANGMYDKYFLINLGGSSNYDRDHNLSVMRKLTISDAITFDNLMKLLSTKSWCNVDKKIVVVGGEVNHITEYCPN